jgi:hypothetical protein
LPAVEVLAVEEEFEPRLGLEVILRDNDAGGQ